MSGKIIKAIVFDLGNVLLPFDYSVAVKRLNEIEENLGEVFLAFYKENYSLHRSFERGDLSREKFISLMLNALHNKIDEETFCKIYSEIFTFNENVASLLPELKKNYKLLLLSNTNEIHKKYGWEQFKFIKYFDKLILSHEVNAVKPEEKIYKSVEAFTGLQPGEHLFIDDILEYVNEAKKLGWDGIQFTGYENLIAELQKKDIQF
ncbi:MAG: HAD-IA family hydrolase [Ignavibacteria bacterium]|nr:HAD-IA family hydrolase [Ignavibacteria bacterium]NCS80472.1 HAD-IA family hydrolase [Ignavibacteria bacterium]OIO21867.1 MAG: haloacid dehalogenase [Ignavibacteria bacterium CG1_02_37_35]PIX93799.1 MAG: HAD family phosphatase [Ignavibacteria bacterium CG_4_10_14_3_um_filter_37_18]